MCAGGATKPGEGGIGKEVRRDGAAGRSAHGSWAPAPSEEHPTDQAGRGGEQRQPDGIHFIHPRRRNQRKMASDTTAITPMAKGYPCRQANSGMNWKFIP